ALIREHLALYPGQILKFKDFPAAEERLARLNKEDVKIFAKVIVLDPEREGEYKDILVQVSETSLEAVSTDMKKLEGAWIVTSASLEGTKIKTIEGAELLFSGAEVTTT